ncbi:unnamed protein product [Paramecium primaurelia]|uniref:Uncharacterized protein n=1 Tax=Paramecium primaurelia TaxID=5886 RepID=A0A8S1PI66_PARPR|nr:unnamed protein product [Paramecium primaurelia]
MQQERIDLKFYKDQFKMRQILIIEIKSICIFYSAKVGQFQTCQILIDADSKINHQDVTKETAIAYAKKFNRKEVLIY